MTTSITLLIKLIYEKIYQNIKKLGNNYHMIKNSEWGALAYLTHSSYGLCIDEKCKEIGTNKTYISGNTIEDSTTNNMYGVFDLSGSASEFVMANFANDNNLTLNNSHFGKYSGFLWGKKCFAGYKS